MLWIVIFPTVSIPLSQHAIALHVRIAVVAIRTLDGHARGGDNYGHNEDPKQCEDNNQWFLASITHLSAQLAINQFLLSSRYSPVEFDRN